MTTPAGWYDDGSGQMRYWDGQGWTQHVAPQADAQPAGEQVASEAAAEPSAQEPAPASAPVEDAPEVAVPVSAQGFAEPDAGGAQVAPQPVYPAASAPLAPGAPVKKSRLALWVTLGLVGLLVLIGGAIAAVVLMVRAVTAGPEEQLDALVVAWRAHDCPAEYELMHPYITDGLTVSEYCDGADYQWFDDMVGWDYEVLGSEVQNTTAYVTTSETYTYGGEAYTDEWVYEFHQVDGRWLYYDATYTE